MPKEEWGVKRVCPKCSVRFYDLQKDPMTCPECGAEFTLESLTAPKSKAAAREKAKEAPTADVKEDDTEDAVVLDDDDNDDDMDDELLEDDDDGTVDLEEIADVAKEDDDS